MGQIKHFGRILDLVGFSIGYKMLYSRDFKFLQGCTLARYTQHQKRIETHSDWKGLAFSVLCTWSYNLTKWVVVGNSETVKKQYRDGRTQFFSRSAVQRATIHIRNAQKRTVTKKAQLLVCCATRYTISWSGRYKLTTIKGKNNIGIQCNKAQWKKISYPRSCQCIWVWCGSSRTSKYRQ